MAFWKELIRQYKPDEYRSNPFLLSFRPEGEDWSGFDFELKDVCTFYKGEPVLGIHIYDRKGELIDLIRVKIPERNAEYVRRIREHCSTCKRITENNVVYPWIKRLGRYSTATELICISCGSEWDYITFGVNAIKTVSNGR